MHVDFRQCGDGDLTTLVKVARETFVDAFEEANDPSDFKTYIKEAFSSATILKELKNKDSTFFFAYEENHIVGYFKLNENKAQTEIREKEGIELERIYVVKNHQNKKIGALMLKKAIEIGLRKKKQYLWLGVWEHNVRAIRFYQRHGFEKFDTHPYYIGNDKQTDWLMRKELANP